jgi:hypothetical protein
VSEKKREEIGKVVWIWKEREAYFERNGYADAENARERQSNDRRIGAER